MYQRGVHCIVLLISLWVFWMQKMGLGSISLMHMHNSIIKKKRKKKKRGRTLLYEILVNISQCVLYCYFPCVIQAASMFLVASAISFSVDKEISNNLSILGTLSYVPGTLTSKFKLSFSLP